MSFPKPGTEVLCRCGQRGEIEMLEGVGDRLTLITVLHLPANSTCRHEHVALAHLLARIEDR